MFCKFFFFFLFNFIIFDFPRSTRYGWTERKGKNEMKKNKNKKKKNVKKKIWKEKKIPSAVADSQITLPRGFEYTRMCKSEWCNYLWSLIRHSLKSTGPPTDIYRLSAVPHMVKCHWESRVCKILFLIIFPTGFVLCVFRSCWTWITWKSNIFLSHS